MIVLFTIWKYIGNYNNLTTVLLEETTAAENCRLSPAKAFSVTYGTWKKDIESGNSSNESYNSSSSADLFDAKICVICYNELRNCFFVPCGHCATCYYCAQRYLHLCLLYCIHCRLIIYSFNESTHLVRFSWCLIFLFCQDF